MSVGALYDAILLLALVARIMEASLRVVGDVLQRSSVVFVWVSVNGVVNLSRFLHKIASSDEVFYVIWL